tara:strand:+ start:85 stop:351 length:267 start_codon:yes stop_codon:yes gene_type:complete
MERVTKKELYSLVEKINNKLEQPRNREYVLDIAYGGYKLGLIVNDGGGQSDIGYYRKTAREMYFFLEGIIIGLYAMDNKRDMGIFYRG